MSYDQTIRVIFNELSIPKYLSESYTEISLRSEIRRWRSAFDVSNSGIRASLERPPSKYDEYVCHRSSAHIQISVDRQAD